VRVYLLILLIWGAFVPPLWGKVLLDKIVAIVGNSYLTLYQLEEMAQPLYKKFIPQNLPPEEKQKLKEEINKQLLKKWIEDTIVEHEAQKYGISVSDAEVERYLKFQIKRLGGEQAFKKFLKSQGINLEEYKKQLKKFLLKLKFVQFYVNEKIVVTPQELKEAYKEFLKHYDASPGYVISVITISGDENRVEEIYKSLLKGESFESICSISGVKCLKGLEIKKKELAPEILKALEKLEPGEITPPLKREEGVWQIFKLLKREKGVPPSFDEVKDWLYKKIFAKKAQKFLEKWIKELEEKKYIKTFL